MPISRIQRSPEMPLIFGELSIRNVTEEELAELERP